MPATQKQRCIEMLEGYMLEYELITMRTSNDLPIDVEKGGKGETRGSLLLVVRMTFCIHRLNSTLTGDSSCRSH